MHTFDVDSFFTVHSMNKEVEFFTCWHYYSLQCIQCKHLSEDVPTMKRAATSIIRSTKIKHVLNDINGNICTYNSEQKQISPTKHTKSELTVS